MTERNLYDAALIEINKLEAPSMLLEDYNYFINKAIQQYINKVYNRYEINQQATDDLMALKRNVTLDVQTLNGKLFAILPLDYMHILNCIITYNKITDSLNCEYTLSNSFGARKLTSDIYPSIINNAYFKPSYKTPYYSINYISETELSSTRILKPCDTNNILDPCDRIWDGGYVIEIKCGDITKYKPEKVYIDYIKKPKLITLTEDSLEGADTTMSVEFPDYVCYEIINEFVKLLLENASDPRLQTNIPINQTILSANSE